ncbi:MAG: hypothetical protein JKY33_07575 [Bacteroidia bacterium]|nr:hypothetical protein [Bacteroidia bacterium]
MKDSSSNTGIVGDAYMNFGSVGLLVWGTVFIFIMKLFDSCAKNKSIAITSAAIAMPVIILTNSALLTTFLTHGLFVAAIMLYFLPTTSSQNNL